MSPYLIDLLIIVALGLYAWDGYRRGFLQLSLELIGMIATFYLAFRFALPFGSWLSQLIQFPDSLRQLIGFFGLWIILQIVYATLSAIGYPLIPEALRKSAANKFGGIVPSMVKGFVMVAVLLTLIVVLPVTDMIKTAVLGSRLASPLISTTQSIEQNLTRTYSKELTETLTFLTTSPLTRKITDQNESLKLPFTATDVTIDQAAETKMLNLINQERAKVGVKPLVLDTDLRDVGRLHAKDMLKRGYFAHNTPEGKDPFDRMHDYGITFLTAGENLAFAPTVDLAHIGLMNSPHHRENILEPEFGHVGIAAISAGLFGTMFVQEFRE
jgi:uncharacterized protein YkwD